MHLINFYPLVDREEECLNHFFKPVFRSHLSHQGFTVSMSGWWYPTVNISSKELNNS